MHRRFYSWAERFLFAPQGLDYLIAFLLLPLSALYCLIVFIKYIVVRPRYLGVPVVSIGNLIVGGSGKTPLTIALAATFAHPAVVLRGYGRKSRGTLCVSSGGAIHTTVDQSGDEAMLLAMRLPHATVIVASNRSEGIALAKAHQAEVVFLDDGYSKHYIEKLDLLVAAPKPVYLPFCLPSGPYREKRWWGKKTLSLIEGAHFTRTTHIENPTSKMVLVTAISKPWRLDAYLPEVCGKVYFPDHYLYEKVALEALVQSYDATSILTTEKDAVKMAAFGLPLSILVLNITLDATITPQVHAYCQAQKSRYANQN